MSEPLRELGAKAYHRERSLRTAARIPGEAGPGPAPHPPATELDPPSHSRPGEEPCTDYGNAERLVRRHGEDFRFVHPLGWYEWDERRWRQDESEAVMRAAKETVRSLVVTAAALEESGRRSELLKWALKSESDDKLRAMVRSAQSEAEVRLPADQLDAEPWLLNVENGTIDLRMGILLDHRREQHLTQLAPVVFDPDATCPLFEAFLAHVLGGNARVIGFLQRFFGYCLTGLTSEQLLLVLYGLGMNGKSTLLELLRWLLGSYARQTAFDTFTTARDGPRSDLARLRAARFVTAIEADADARLNEVLVKMLTGEDSIVARFLYQDLFEFRPTFKIVVAANHRPRVHGTDLAIWRRIKLVPFKVTIMPDQRDAKLGLKLRAEASGILNWALAGCLAWQREGLNAPPEVEAATAEYRADQDPLGGFLADRCELGAEYTSQSSDLYRAYKTWAEEAGEPPISTMRFGLRLTERGIGKDKDGPGHTVRRLGVRLIGADTPDTPDTFPELRLREDGKESYGEGVPGVPGVPTNRGDAWESEPENGRPLT